MIILENELLKKEKESWNNQVENARLRKEVENKRAELNSLMNQLKIL